MTDLVALRAANATRWSQAKITPSRRTEVLSVARRLVAPSAKARYQAISLATGVPWHVIAVIHEREASQNFGRQLGQGDPLGQVSVHRPKGRGPFHDHDGHDAFYWGACDALVNCAPFAARWHDWTAAGALTLLIEYNGTGYEDYHHEPSPYDWGATNIEQYGKYVSDGVFSATTWDTQVGCAAMFLAMMELDPTITFLPGVTITLPAPPARSPIPAGPVLVPRPAPPIAPAQPATGISRLIAAIASIFRRKT